jgi:WD40 repeat protein
LWNIDAKDEPLRFSGMGGVDRIAYSPKSKLVAATGGRSVEVYDFTLDAATPEQTKRIDALIEKLDDEAYAIREQARKDILAVGFVAEPRLRKIMKTSPSAEVRIRSRRLRETLLTTPRISFTGHTEQVEALAFSLDGRVLASGSKDGSVRLWKVADAKEPPRILVNEGK